MHLTNWEVITFSQLLIDYAGQVIVYSQGIERLAICIMLDKTNKIASVYLEATQWIFCTEL